MNVLEHIRSLTESFSADTVIRIFPRLPVRCGTRRCQPSGGRAAQSSGESRKSLRSADSERTGSGGSTECAELRRPHWIRFRTDELDFSTNDFPFSLKHSLQYPLTGRMNRVTEWMCDGLNAFLSFHTLAQGPLHSGPP